MKENKFKTHELLNMHIDFEEYKDLIMVDGILAPSIRSNMTKMFKQDSIGDLI